MVALIYLTSECKNIVGWTQMTREHEPSRHAEEISLWFIGRQMMLAIVAAIMLLSSQLSLELIISSTFISDLKKSTMATATRTERNKRSNEQNNSAARAF